MQKVKNFHLRNGKKRDIIYRHIYMYTQKQSHRHITVYSVSAVYSHVLFENL